MAFRRARPNAASTLFDFDDFKTTASQDYITTAIPEGRKTTYTNTLEHLEEAIIKKDIICFKINVSTFDSLLDNCRNVKWNTIKTKFEQMKHNVENASNKFADPFKYIQLHDSSSASSALEFEKNDRGQLAITRMTQIKAWTAILGRQVTERSFNEIELKYTLENSKCDEMDSILHDLQNALTVLKDQNDKRKRNDEIVKETNKEIEDLTDDIINWTAFTSFNEFDKDKTGALVALRSARLHLQERKMQQVEKRQSLTSLKVQVKDMETDLREWRGEASYWKDQAMKEENEKIDLMIRLSKIASAKLTNDNPNIEDLSDPNRPKKLAEEYSQLYDNEWTSAYEDVERKPDLNPIDYLRDILTAVYEKCAEIRKLQIKEIEISILQPVKLLPTLSKELKNTKPQTSTGDHPEDVVLGENHRKAISDVVRQTYTDVQRNLNKYFSSCCVEWFKTQHLKEYTTKCIELCWLMNIHSPPVCLGPIVQKGATFDKAIYRDYTARGTKVEFVVWPAILLRENGPLLGKGVAQGMK